VESAVTVDAAAIEPGHGPARPRRRWRWADLGVLPLMTTLPFMYYPKLLDGDTQPWVLVAGLLALFTFRTARFATPTDMSPILLAIACAGVYAIRSDGGLDVVRAFYTQAAFIVFWLVCRRENNEFFPAAVRLTIVVWLAVGVYQYFALALGWPVEIAGRYVEGRSGVPSLTSEPSTYGSLSMLHMMYLLTRDERKNVPYIAAAAISVVLSGSVLALILLIFPLLKLKARLRMAALIALPALALVDFLFTSAGLTSRLQSIGADGAGLASLLLDPSLNLRVGHLVFTLGANFFDSVLLLSPLGFMDQYNAFAQNSGLFIDTGSDFILPALGELIYGSGIFGLLLLARVLYLAQARSTGSPAKFEKIFFALMCMLNPISLSNFFLVLYLNRRN
jgi:hypothetical protein